MASLKSGGARAALFVLLLAGLAVGTYLAAQALTPKPPDTEGDGDEAASAAPDGAFLAQGERFEKVRELERSTFAEFRGRVDGEGRVPIRAPAGMIVPIVAIRKEQGDVVRKGDVLLEFHEPAIREAIEKARKDGDEDKVKRFTGYLDYVKLRSPVDGQVIDIATQEGHTPLNTDIGLALMTLADDSSYVFRVDVPGDTVSAAAFLGAKLDVMVQVGDSPTLTKFAGVVASYEEAAEGFQRVVVQLGAEQGLERDLVGVVKIPVGKEVVGLVPEAAIRKKGEVQIVRVWDPESRTLSDRTIVTDGAVKGEKGQDLVVTAGVMAGEHVVVPESRRAERR